MAEARIVKKRKIKSSQAISPYFAVRSKNEIYYQMASVFKAVTKDENELAWKILGDFMGLNHQDIFVEKVH